MTTTSPLTTPDVAFAEIMANDMLSTLGTGLIWAVVGIAAFKLIVLIATLKGW